MKVVQTHLVCKLAKCSSLPKFFCALLLTLMWVVPKAGSQSQQPLVAIHDSELTRFLDSSNAPAISPTPTGTNTTGLQWWYPDWHYFVMPESLKEALHSDGTAFTVVGDSNIAS